MSEKQKAIIEIDLPNSCSCCILSFIHTDYNDNDKNGCGYIQSDVSDYTYSRHPECPLKTHEYTSYEDSIRIGHSGDALQLFEEMIEKCKIQPRSDYNDMEKNYGRSAH